MAQCDSKVFFPDDPTQPPQFNDCPRRAETIRRTSYSIVKLCAKCAEVWDEHDREGIATAEALVEAPASNAPKFSIGVSAITPIGEARHRALLRSYCIRRRNWAAGMSAAAQGSPRQQEHTRC